MSNSRNLTRLQEYLSSTAISDIYKKQEENKISVLLSGISGQSGAIGRLLDFNKGTPFYPGTAILIESWEEAQKKNEIELWYLLANAIVAYDLLDFRGQLRTEAFDIFVKPFLKKISEEDGSILSSIATGYMSGLIIQPLLEHLEKSYEIISNHDDISTRYIETQKVLPDNFEAIIANKVPTKEIFKELETRYVSSQIKSEHLKSAIAAFFAGAESDAKHRLNTALEKLETHINQSNGVNDIKKAVLLEVRLARDNLPAKEAGNLPYYIKLKKLELLTAVCAATAKDPISVTEYNDLIDEVSQNAWLKRLGSVMAGVGALLLIGGCITIAVLTGVITIPFVIGTISAVMLGVMAIGAGLGGAYLLFNSIKNNPLEKAMKNTLNAEVRLNS